MTQRGSVILVSFPFSDLSRRKLRPAVVLADAGRGDWVLCQVTSNRYSDQAAIPLVATDFAAGGLHRDSFARPARLFTASDTIFVREVGLLQPIPLQQLLRAVSDLFA